MATVFAVYSSNTSGLVNNAAIASDAAITSTKIALADGSVLIGNASGQAAAQTLSGDITVTNAGATSISSGVIIDADVNASAAIAYSKLALTGAILNEDLAGSIADSKLSTISTAGKVSNSATTASSANTASNIVARDANGDFAARDISARMVILSGTTANATDVATKAYVDSVAVGMDVKDACTLATAAALPAYTRNANVITASGVGVLTVDGVATVLNDRILVKNGAAGADNGIYYVSTEGTAGVAYVLTRAADADASSEVTNGMFTFVQNGTVNGATGWILTTSGAINLNTTALTFTQFSAATVTLAGAGLVQNGNTLDVAVGNGLSVGANQLDLTLDGATLTKGASGLKVSDTYPGNTSLVTLGTVTAGTWSGTEVAATKGGTGQTVYAVGDLLHASTTTALSKLAAVATGNALISGGANTVSTWGKIGLTTHVSGVLPMANGGSNADLTAAIGGIVYSTASAMAILAAGSSGQILQSGGAGAPGWTTATYPATASAAGNLLISGGTNFASTALSGDVSSVSGAGAVTLTGREGAADVFTNTKRRMVESILDGTVATPTPRSGVGLIEGVADEGQVIPTATPDTNVRVLTGGTAFNHRGERITIATGAVTIPTHATEVRWHVVVADSSGALQVRSVATASTDPTLTAGDLPLARVRAPAASGTINYAQIDDLRNLRWMDGLRYGGMTSNSTGAKAAMSLSASSSGVYQVEVDVSGWEAVAGATNDKYCSFKIIGLFRNDGGSALALMDDQYVSALRSSGDTTWNAAVAANGTNIDVNVTPQSANSTKWKVRTAMTKVA